MDGNENQIDTGQTKKLNQEKFVPLKTKLAAKKKEAKKAMKLQMKLAEFEDPENPKNLTLPIPRVVNPEVRRGGWNKTNVDPKLGFPPNFDIFSETKPFDLPPSRNIQMLKVGLGILGGIALFLGAMASILYIHKKRRPQRKPPKPGQRMPPPIHPNYQTNPQLQYYPPVPPVGDFSQYPQNGWRNQPVNSFGPMHQQMNSPPQNYDPNFYPGQIPNQGFYGMPQYPGQFQYPQEYYHQMAAYQAEMMQGGFAPDSQFQGQYVQQGSQYPQSEAGESQTGFDPVLNYVETLGDHLKTPQRKAKKRKEGSSTPHPIITRRPSCKSVKSEISIWTEDEDGKSIKSNYLSQENVFDQEHSDIHEETDSVKEKSILTESSPQLSQTADSAYGSRGSIQSPHNNSQKIKGVVDIEPLIIPPFRIDPEDTESDDQILSVSQFHVSQTNHVNFQDSPKLQPKNIEEKIIIGNEI